MWVAPGSHFRDQTCSARSLAAAKQLSAARHWAPLARFIVWEAALGERAEARGAAAHFGYEFVRFGVKQAWACLFAALMLALIVGTYFFYPHGAPLAIIGISCGRSQLFAAQRRTIVRRE